MKTSAWTDEERAEMAKRRIVDQYGAYVRDERGHLVAAFRRPWEGHFCPEYEHCSLCVDEAADCAAAIVGGFIGMGIEIGRAAYLHSRFRAK